jgi:hypothetical protein
LSNESLSQIKYNIEITLKSSAFLEDYSLKVADIFEGIEKQIAKAFQLLRCVKCYIWLMLSGLPEGYHLYTQQVEFLLGSRRAG